MNKPPCIRNLPAFKDGCPERPWNGREGCPAWIEKNAPTTGDPLKKDMHRMCIDQWQFKLLWDLQGKVEGSLIAIEHLRNGMLFYDDKTKTVLPKPDYATLELVREVKQRRRELEEQGALEYDHDGKM